MLALKIRRGERVYVGRDCVVELIDFGKCEARIAVRQRGACSEHAARLYEAVPLPAAGGTLCFAGLRYGSLGKGVLSFDVPRNVRVIRGELISHAEQLAIEAAAHAAPRSTQTQGGRP